MMPLIAKGFVRRSNQHGGHIFMFPVLPDQALTADIAILGKKGRGKSYAAKGVAERLLDLGERVLILDPLGHWWGSDYAGI
jgi:DNA helicase HerA-like ATPase